MNRCGVSHPVTGRIREPNIRFWVATEGIVGAVSGTASGCAWRPVRRRRLLLRSAVLSIGSQPMTTMPSTAPAPGSGSGTRLIRLSPHLTSPHFTAIASTSIRNSGRASRATPMSVSAGLWSPNSSSLACSMTGKYSDL